MNRDTLAKLGLLGSLYFSQGLPYGFFTQALPVMLRKEGYSLAAIGLASLLALPWALKFIWAPLVDRYWIARYGRRKSWIVPLQLAGVAVLLALAAAPETQSMQLLGAAVLLLNFVAATQDIATDGLAVELLAPSERGLANGLQVAGYRVGMIMGGGVLLILYDRLGNDGTFLWMAAMTALATLPVARMREPELLGEARAALEPPSATLHFVRRPGALGILLLIFVYKAGDAFATAMLRPFLADAGFGLTDVGWLLGTVGFVSGLLGAVSGGALVNRVGRKRALILFGFFQSITVGSYAYLAAVTPTREALYVLCAAEHFAGGMATAALFTCMMDWCSREASGTDYTVQASTVVIATGLAGSLAGFSAEALGYVQHFALSAVLSLGALAFVQRFFPSDQVAEGVRRSTKAAVLSAPPRSRD